MKEGSERATARTEDVLCRIIASCECEALGHAVSGQRKRVKPRPEVRKEPHDLLVNNKEDSG